jgi:pimeloyl-ACP methyl ester carboxylesterase
MERAKVNGIELEYELRGSGEPLLLISPMVAGAFLPFMAAPALTRRYRLIRYHRRGWSGSTHTPGPVTIEDHADDAAALLDRLGVGRAHVAGHSSGAVIGLQLAVARPDLVHTVTLLEPSIMSVPAAATLFQQAAPSLDAFQRGEHEPAVVGFLSLVSGLDRESCRRVIDASVPGGVAQAVRDADTVFRVELPALGAWEFGAEQAAAITQPVLSVLGANTGQLWVEVAALVRDWFPQLEELVVEGVGHLLQMQAATPVAEGVAEFLGRHPMATAEAGRARSAGGGAGG